MNDCGENVTIIVAEYDKYPVVYIQMTEKFLCRVHNTL